jgi:hypothetical protein
MTILKSFLMLYNSPPHLCIANDTMGVTSVTAAPQEVDVLAMKCSSAGLAVQGVQC